MSGNGDRAAQTRRLLTEAWVAIGNAEADANSIIRRLDAIRKGA